MAWLEFFLFDTVEQHFIVSGFNRVVLTPKPEGQRKTHLEWAGIEPGSLTQQAAALTITPRAEGSSKLQTFIILAVPELLDGEVDGDAEVLADGQVANQAAFFLPRGHLSENMTNWNEMSAAAISQKMLRSACSATKFWPHLKNRKVHLALSLVELKPSKNDLRRSKLQQ